MHYVQVQPGSTTPQSSGVVTPSTSELAVVDQPEAVASTPRSTASSTALSGCFCSEKELELFLSTHVKSKHSLARMKAGTGAVNDRRDITYVVGAKVIDTWGSYPKKEILVSVSLLLASITGLPAELFFEPKSWKGALMRTIENSRRLLHPKDKRWIWSETAKRKHDVAGDLPTKRTAAVESAQDEEPGSSASSTASDGASSLLEDLNVVAGCCRSLEECDFCLSKLCCK